MEKQIVEQLLQFMQKDAGATVDVHINEDSSLHMLYMQSSQMKELCAKLVLDFNSSLPEQNGCPFADTIFKCIFMNEIFVFRFKYIETLPQFSYDFLKIVIRFYSWIFCNE